MKIPWNVSELEIVGYANVLKATMLPSVVPPVFRLQADSDRVLLPPYSFSAGFLYNSTEVSASELAELAYSREITLFDNSFPAHAGFELWIDQLFQWHYAPREEVDDTLRQIADNAIRQANNAMQSGNLEEAERQSSVAISADDRRVEPLVIKAAICRINGDPEGEHLMRSLASPVINGDSFTVLVGCSVTQPPPRAEPTQASHRHMKGVASQPAA